MQIPTFIAFTPVPLRVRADGWSPQLQLAFVRALAEGAKPGEAARALGKNRQNAYALRRRPGAESFAAAWDEAVAYARRRRVERPTKSDKSDKGTARLFPPMESRTFRTFRAKLSLFIRRR